MDNQKNSNWKHFDVMERDPDESPWHRWMPAVSSGVLVIVLGGAGYFLIQKMSGSGVPQPPKIQQISIVMPPPPPPPPPKMEEPEPVEELELETPEPEPVVDDGSDQDPGDEGLMEGDGVANSSMTVNKGKPRRLGGNSHAWYAGILQRELQTLLSNDEAVRGLGEYAVVVSISLSGDGRVAETRLLSGSNDPKLDAALRKALSSGVRLSRQPPEDLPQPIRLRITSRG